MITFQCEACWEAYDQGGVLCPRHERVISDDIARFGQPSTLADQLREEEEEDE